MCDPQLIFCNSIGCNTKNVPTHDLMYPSIVLCMAMLDGVALSENDHVCSVGGGGVFDPSLFLDKKAAAVARSSYQLWLVC